MFELTKLAISNDMKDVLLEVSKTLKQNNIRYMVIGGLAVGAYSKPRTTEDIDFLVYHHDISKIIELFGEGSVISNGYTINYRNIDLDFSYSDDDFLYHNKNDIGFDIPNKQNLLYLKLKAGRAKDDADVIEIIKNMGVQEVKKCKKQFQILNQDMFDNFESLSNIAALEQGGIKDRLAFIKHQYKKILKSIS
jgi:hypothetical protein